MNEPCKTLSAPDYTVAAVDEALALLLKIAQTPGLGLTELAQASHNTKARAFRLLYTLEHRGLIRKEGRQPAYYLGPKALYLGLSAQEQTRLIGLVRPHLRELGRLFSENVQMRIRDGLETLCIARWDTVDPDRVHNDVSARRPLYVGASGKVLLAHSPPEVFDALLSQPLAQRTRDTLVKRSQLTQELDRIRANGYAISRGENTPHAAAVAVPIWNQGKQVIASLSVAGPDHRFSNERTQSIKKKLLESALIISARCD
ncbi:IclR family transcriptional regulator [Paralcaligenes sp. KSB-10]|uniref:IclR family transcriptional regulator n=1 Tax=Paralcaligenes sp. KSB-10 TaxID=2901142 RepID=UPI001E2AEEC2|nr:IclR family transcriptional regulator [Paralcaligenes sp. KSB-10]UHL65446.1 IclR family transcriptional regulator [Paralcaligenes sp. KSB-10]